ncbi:hypothetical protein H0E87_004198 [Populus deltoides]|uniref:Ribonucleotide reductase large subunit C-terminal domain-containing protein n=1 Tax=Populus deltoides TaxID=3696 RepID=A0A8T2ZFP6_POPDE|nr:hypothetical protein H0E87_004198 [Populus deltoides]
MPSAGRTSSSRLVLCSLDSRSLHGKSPRKGQKKVVSARKLWFEILNSQTETGTPYMLFHDTVVTDLQLQVGKNRVMCWFRSNPS